MAIPAEVDAPELSHTPVEDFLTRLQPLALGLLHRHGIPPEDAEDILQDTLCIYLKKRPRVKRPVHWVLGTLRNRCLMFWRERQRRPYFAMDAEVLEALAAPQPPPQDAAALWRDLERSLDRLPPRSREVIYARYTLGYSPGETASLLGYKKSGIYKVIERSLTTLAEQMNDDGLELRTPIGGAS